VAYADNEKELSEVGRELERHQAALLDAGAADDSEADDDGSGEDEDGDGGSDGGEGGDGGGGRVGRGAAKRAALARELKARTRVVCDSAQVARALYARLLSQAATEGNDEALAALQVVAVTVTHTLSSASDLVAALDAAAAARREAEAKEQAVARAKRPRGPRRSKNTKPSAQERPHWVSVTQTRAAVLDQRLAEWGFCDVVRFVMKPGEQRGSVNAALAGGEAVPTNAELKPVTDAIEAMLAAVRARIASGAAAGPSRPVDPESEPDL